MNKIDDDYIEALHGFNIVDRYTLMRLRYVWAYRGIVW